MTPAGTLMTTADWDHDFGRSLMVHLGGEAIAEPDEQGQKIFDDSFILCFNAHHERIDFTS